jgi:hypothetical protein
LEKSHSIVFVFLDVDQKPYSDYVSLGYRNSHD